MDTGNALLTESTNSQLMGYWAIQFPSNKGAPKKLQTECTYLSNYMYTAVNLSDFQVILTHFRRPLSYEGKMSL